MRPRRWAGAAALAVALALGPAGCAAPAPGPAPSSSGASDGPAAPSGPGASAGSGGPMFPGTDASPPGPSSGPSPVPAVPGDPLAGLVLAPEASARPSRGGALLAPTASGPLTGRTIVVDPGHNGAADRTINDRQVPRGDGTTKPCNTTGTVAVDGTPEHAVNWSVAVRLVGLLRARGATVALTRPDEAGIGPCVDERAAIANRLGADLVLSIHGDSAPAAARGFHVIVAPAMAGGPALSERSAAAAAVLVTELDRAALVPRSTYVGGGTGIDRRIDIAGLNLLTATPGIMLEMGNLANAADWTALKPDAARDSLARALAVTAERVLAS